jgi:hypothetical protein
MKRRIAQLVLVVLTMASIVLSTGPGATASPRRAVPLNIAETLRANPGSVQIGEDAILLRPGVMTVLPSRNATSALAAGDPNRCPRGWTCAWSDTDFRGAMLGLQEGVYTDYVYWWFNAAGNVFYHAGSNPDPGNLQSFSNSASSVFNNTYNLLWAPFYSWRNNKNYYAYRGAPAAYVGSQWNDSFTAACGCP